MNREQRLIDLMARRLPRSGRQQNQVHAADAEILTWQGRTVLFTMDEFSAEDQLRIDDPFDLGWNCAVGALSDIFACGGKPIFYAHSLTAAQTWTDRYIGKFTAGIAAALRRTQTAFIGGDFGQARDWRYTASVLAEPLAKPIQRIGAKPGDGIFISGRLGRGNYEALLNLRASKAGWRPLLRPIHNRFVLRQREAALVSRFASAAIDTSDGGLNALNTLADMSRAGYCVRDLPFIGSGATAARLLSLSRLLLFMGECGEYELLFTVRKNAEEKFRQAAQAERLRFYRIGEITPAATRTVVERDRAVDLRGFDCRARDFKDTTDYIRELTKYLEKAGL